MRRAVFRKPELEDKEVISSYFKKYPSESCDRTFANVYLWSGHYHVEIAEYENTILFRNESTDYGFAFPAGDDESVRAVIPKLAGWAEEDGQPFFLYGITEEEFEKLERWFPNRFQVEYERDYEDYVYNTEILASLSGKKFHGKRNHLNKFKAIYQDRWNYEPLSDSNIEECFQMALQWRNLNGCEEDEEKNAEMCVTLNSLRLFKELELRGGVLRIDAKVVAFALGEPVNKEMFVVHIEKAYTSVEGAYTMMNQQFVEHEILGKYKYVNREDDAGVEGLRKAKLSYRPVFLVKKGIVTQKDDITSR